MVMMCHIKDGESPLSLKILLANATSIWSEHLLHLSSFFLNSTEELTLNRFIILILAELRLKCEEYATALLDHTRTSYELEVMLNYDPNGPIYEKGERMKLERLKLAIICKQKTFVAHPNVQQLLAAVWYEGSPGFRRKGPVGQLLDISKMATMFPVYSMAYMMAPSSSLGQTMKKPFTKFIVHSSAYCCFLMLLIMASQRVETLVMEWIGTDYFLQKSSK
ncbi:transient receptor potential-gamma protein [Caerostris extrusa]|uniref:Transient receptor potential-gamma protein n=1 Tax=Caerostris extrusa TaxID=172846 RepID=A0AAV4VGM7_CAEEX|nr:transient receptor potential-gamma protein [Caerostris extrusa]